MYQGGPKAPLRGWLRFPKQRGPTWTPLQPFTCTMSLQVVVREPNGKDGQVLPEVYLLRGLRWESLGSSRGLFFPCGTQCIRVLDIHHSHLCCDCTCCSWVMPLPIEHWAGTVRCPCRGSHQLMPSEGSVGKHFHDSFLKLVRADMKWLAVKDLPMNWSRNRCIPLLWAEGAHHIDTAFFTAKVQMGKNLYRYGNLAIFSLEFQRK